MLKRGLPIGSVYSWFIGCKMNKAVQIFANFRQIWPDILLKFANILPDFIRFSLRQTNCKQTLALMAALALCACQSDPDAMDYSGNAHRQKECNRILAQLGVSGDNILDADVASTPERKKLVALYSAYGCDK